jgi:cation diffusion facilitator CzcD-associated flavoprotein CzcO
VGSSGPSVAIIGAGFGGLATAVKLRGAGIDDFVIFEQSPAPGGTWYDNTYPGCEVDIPSPIYSFSFMSYDWSRTHCRAGELQQYAEDLVDRFGIRCRIRFGTRVEAVRWDEVKACYQLTTADGEALEFGVVVSAVGFLNVPKYPDWPGREDFVGPAFHSSRWEHEHDLSGRTVALVGTGSTAVQLTPEIAKVAKRLFVFQREPGWVIPKRSRAYRGWVRVLRRRFPVLQKLPRLGWWLAYEVGARNAFKVGSVTNRAAQRLCVRYIESQIEDPALRELVTPKYPFGCKRPVFADTYYQALNQDNVTLVPYPVKSVTADAVLTDNDQKYPVDALVMATGFQPQRYLSTISVSGVDGRDLHDVWGDTPTAFLGLTVPGFPNFFMIFGPNTNGGNAITFQLERQAEATVRAIARMKRRRIAVLDTAPGAHGRFNRWLERELGSRLDAAMHCNNYYFSPSGKNVTQWPRGSLDYWLLTRILPARAFIAGAPVNRTRVAVEDT